MPASAKELLLAAAVRHGFDECRVARAAPAPHAEALGRWLEAGHHATMDWMDRTRNERSDPALILPGVRSIVVLATNYLDGEPPDSFKGRIARYARGRDYHDVIPPKLQALSELLASAGGTQRCFVDGGPVLERDWAAVSGVSWHGKSTMGIHPRLGTWFFLSVILTTLDLDADEPMPDRCGRCTRCIESCPTRAIIAPYQLDARRCLSFLTIENKGPIPPEFRPALGDRIFGCDDCLEACPWNRFARASRDSAFQAPAGARPGPLRDYLALDDTAFKALFRGSPILRAKRRGFLRNVCVALGNTGTAEDLPALNRSLEDKEPLVREHAAWAIEIIRARPEPLS